MLKFTIVWMKWIISEWSIKKKFGKIIERKCLQFFITYTSFVLSAIETKRFTCSCSIQVLWKDVTIIRKGTYIHLTFWLDRYVYWCVATRDIFRFFSFSRSPNMTGTNIIEKMLSCSNFSNRKGITATFFYEKTILMYTNTTATGTHIHIDKHYIYKYIVKIVMRKISVEENDEKRKIKKKKKSKLYWNQANELVYAFSLFLNTNMTKTQNLATRK